MVLNVGLYTVLCLLNVPYERPIYYRFRSIYQIIQGVMSPIESIPGCRGSILMAKCGQVHKETSLIMCHLSIESLLTLLNPTLKLKKSNDFVDSMIHCVGTDSTQFNNTVINSYLYV